MDSEWSSGKRLFFNIDGVVQLESRNAASRGVIRDENGD
ncbi:hypothetical protein Golob_013332 [Gossypium lobatum]|uniref:Uncharacterized protein n=1 Tax=Gossypium lobatum TaxID=34289 RepID=A0A7J8LP42_9ROSI|nr:hypothetical protein [Gossypium lobatum]